MTENLLQYIWQHQYFNKSALRTDKGEALNIINKGSLNKNQGPDFLNAKIEIDSTILVGSIELHLKTSDWFKHQHSNDANYKNVILHVVFQNDLEVSDLAVLELQPRVSSVLLNKYNSLMNQKSFIACSNSLSSVKKLTWMAWKERLLIERLIRKSALVFSFLDQNNVHWEETFWWLLARNFGIAINADAFEAIAKSIPINILAKHKNQIHQLEALLLGQANLLNENFKEDYPKFLQVEYNFLKIKYQLKPVHSPVFFLRIRPSNFPTIRLAQLAMLVHGSQQFFSKIIEAESLDEITECLAVTANDYWNYHYHFDEISSYQPKRLGVAMMDNIIINTIIPILFAYGHYQKNENLKTKALHWLEQTKAESNTIITNYKKLGVESASAFDTQALLELNKQYCTQKLCLQCSIGAAILKTS
ncbi:MAG: DUF2851 domain-containing protein [Chitinophagaceae bacterium]